MALSNTSAGDRLRASVVNSIITAVNNVTATSSVQVADSSVTDGTTTSLTFTNSLTTTGIRGISFTAPPSGKVMVAGSSFARQGTANQYALLDFEVRAGSTVGSGAVARAADENSLVGGQSDSASQQFTGTIAPTLVTGLTPGAVYNACLVYRTLANTATYNRRKIAVYPLAN